MTPFDIWSLCVYGLVVALLLAGVLAISSILGERHAEPATGELFESGIVTVGEARFLVPVKFYLVAMFFVIFDLEAVFLYAWAASAHIAGWTGFWEAAVFVGVLLAVLAYLWRVGAIDWAPQGSRDAGASERAGG